MSDLAIHVRGIGRAGESGDVYRLFSASAEPTGEYDKSDVVLQPDAA
ncbi:hypothetical protein Pcaca02_06670 [Pectobacterium carotovorum subsp. carotovorum]|nr:hypothetical protein Pcaca02_06670 [Pectobacterium carotovorum subsp. carotovorum]